ncbi:MAG TPA: hypothetical protein VIW24_02710 [Aldersonia sp.]
MPTFRPTTPEDLVRLIADRVRTVATRAVVAVDGADAARPLHLAEQVRAAIRADGRAAHTVSLHDYVRPASLRLEYGHADEESYRTMWFDYAALRREVIDNVRESGRWLPRLWDADTDRSARDRIRTAGDDDVVLVAGPMLLGRGLGFDVAVRLDLSAGALERATAPEDRWTVPALLDHDAVAEVPDVFVRWDHPERPAVRVID